MKNVIKQFLLSVALLFTGETSTAMINEVTNITNIRSAVPPANPGEAPYYGVFSKDPSMLGLRLLRPRTSHPYITNIWLTVPPANHENGAPYYRIFNEDPAILGRITARPITPFCRQ
ncbi:MAG: hypothetical protein LBO73_02910 [Holosporaceae bacterium]|nr:hypothetical protein [Holosporaceae bacterium]